MRIATFNIENLDFPLEHRLAVLRPALERMEADIICLQEVNSQKVPNTSERELRALEHLLDGTEYADFHRAETHSERHGGVASTHNLVTLSRYPIAGNRQIWHQRVPPARIHLCSVEGSDASPTVVRFDRPFLVTAIDVNDTNAARLQRAFCVRPWRPAYRTRRSPHSPGSRLVVGRKAIIYRV